MIPSLIKIKVVTIILFCFRFYARKYDDSILKIDGRVLKFPIQSEATAVEAGKNISGIHGIRIKIAESIIHF